MEYADRSTGLTVFGIGEIVLGFFALLAIPLTLLGAVLARKTMGTLPAGTYVQSVATDLAAAVLLITLGMGSIQAKRWARTLNLIAAWLGLVIGVVSTIVMTVVIPAGFMGGMQAAAARNPGLPPMSRAFIAVILTGMIVFVAVFFVAVPLAYVVFFGRKDVEETCKRRDPMEHWTERRPLPVLAVSLIFAFGAVYYLSLSMTLPFMPFFGRYLVGFAGGAACVVVAALNAALAVALYRMKPAAWWIAAGLLVLRCVSSAITFPRANLLAAYSKLGWSGRQLEMLSRNPALRSGATMWTSLVYMLILLGYMIGIRKYFAGAASPAGNEGALARTEALS
jgi:hypothetical protein